MGMIRTAVLAAVLGLILEPISAAGPAGAHPGHAYFEQPCCGHNRLRHRKGNFQMSLSGLHNSISATN